MQHHVDIQEKLNMETSLRSGGFFLGVVLLRNGRNLKRLKILGNFFLSYGIFGILFFTLFFTFQSKEKAIVEYILALYGISRML